MNNPLAVIVNGAATEGYWAVQHLLRGGRFRVRATVRRLSSPAVARLRELSVEGRTCEIVEAATEDEAALSRAFAGANAIYGTSIYDIHAKHYDPANPRELAQGRALLAAARGCGTLTHFVWQTMTRFETTPEDIGQESPIHFRTKWQLEEMIRDAGLPWTMLRQPAYLRQLKFGLQYRWWLVYPYPSGVRLAFVAEEDLGKLVAAVMAAPDAFMHRAVNAVSEVTTPAELARRAHAVVPRISPHYRQASWPERAVFDQVIVRLRPAFRYPQQINGNLRAGNPFAITREDREQCARLVAPLRLVTAEDWLREYYGVPTPSRPQSG